MNITEYEEKYKRLYNTNEAAKSLDQARADNTTFYRGVCFRHGPVVLYTKDNTCPVCQRINREHRYKTNKAFNRSRGLRNELAKRAKKKNIEFDLSTDQIRALLQETDTCPILGSTLNKNVSGHCNDTSPSVDRLRSDKGYVMSNINIVSNRANRIKNDGTATEHLLIAAWMLQQEGLTDVATKVRRIIKEINRD